MHPDWRIGDGSGIDRLLTVQALSGVTFLGMALGKRCDAMPDFSKPPAMIMTPFTTVTAHSVIVTGGTSGIGAGVSRMLAAAGWQVLAATAFSAGIDSFEPTAGITPVRIDVTEQASVDGASAAIESHLAGLVNCAGILQRGGAEFQIDAFRQTVEANLVGTLQMCRAVKPRLAAVAAIVNMASMLSTFGSAAVPGYSASKGGVVQLTKSLVAAWATDQVWGSATARSSANAQAVACGWQAGVMGAAGGGDAGQPGSRPPGTGFDP